MLWVIWEQVINYFSQIKFFLFFALNRTTFRGIIAIEVLFIILLIDVIFEGLIETMFRDFTSFTFEFIKKRIACAFYFRHIIKILRTISIYNYKLH